MEDLEEMKSMFNNNNRNKFEVDQNAEDEMNNVTTIFINILFIERQKKQK